MGELYGMVDCGGTLSRIAVMDAEMRTIGEVRTLTDVLNYQAAVESYADTMQQIAAGNGELVSVVFAMAGELDEDERLVRAGTLTPWLGRCASKDTAALLGLPEERTASINDMVAVGISQAKINSDNKRNVVGYVTTLSSGWGGAAHSEDGKVWPDEPGHQYLRDGHRCLCGSHGHAEAFISGNGVAENVKKDMKTWLQDPANADQFVADLTEAVVGLAERHEANGLVFDEIRWTGGVATNQVMLMRRAAVGASDMLGYVAPAWDSVTMGTQAGLHGAYIEAVRRARAG